VAVFIAEPEQQQQLWGTCGCANGIVALQGMYSSSAQQQCAGRQQCGLLGSSSSISWPVLASSRVYLAVFKTGLAAAQQQIHAVRHVIASGTKL
jgi:hypothetical protein